MIDRNTEKTPAHGRRAAGRGRQIGSEAGSPLPPSQEDWKPGQGIIDRMLAYRDWWNIPARRSPGATRP